MKPDGALDHEAMAPIVTDLFLGGLGAVQVPDRPSPQPSPARGRGSKTNDKELSP
jgi:hypothetical protein